MWELGDGGAGPARAPDRLAMLAPPLEDRLCGLRPRPGAVCPTPGPSAWLSFRGICQNADPTSVPDLQTSSGWDLPVSRLPKAFPCERVRAPPEAAARSAAPTKRRGGWSSPCAAGGRTPLPDVRAVLLVLLGP